MPFVRVLRKKENMEVLFNTDHISRIEVRYGEPSNNPDDTMLHGVTLRQGLTDVHTIRDYTIYAGGDSFHLIGDGDDPVIRIIQEIYEQAIRAPEPHEREGTDGNEGPHG